MPLVQPLFHASNVGFGSGPYTPSGSAVVTAGNDIFVLIGIPGPGTNFTCTDNLGNIYTVLYEASQPGGAGSNAKQVLMRAPITVGGTLTSIQIDWDNTTTAVGLCSAEFSGAGTFSGWSNAGSGSGTSGSIVIGAVSGLLFFNFVAFGQISGLSLPAGYALADSATVASSSGEQIYMAYKEGTDSGTKTATWTTSREFHIVAADVTTPPPPVSKLSFDGVFVR